MPSDRTMVTELGTALGLLGPATVDESLRSRSAVMHSLSPESWSHLQHLRDGGAFDAEFHAAWENGRAFLTAEDGLRGRRPRVVEWKGTGRAPGDEVAPVDLRVDHVYLISCKYLSNILFNVSPSHVFDDLLVGGGGRGRRGAAGETARSSLPEGTGRGGGDWYAEVAPDEYQALYDEVRTAVASAGDAGPAPGAVQARAGAGGRRESGVPGAPARPGLGDAGGAGGASSPAPRRTGRRWRHAQPFCADCRRWPSTSRSSSAKRGSRTWLRGGWPGEAKKAYQALSERVSFMSVRRWELAMDRNGGTGETMLWRLLRMGSAPYFVLGSSATRSLRLRIATPWDWRQHFSLGAVFMTAQRGGQPRVGWEAVVRNRATHEVHELAGHIEVRWSHGRFGGPPEAKGYLDTPHHLVPGYFALR